jgi:hypothetical protein
MASEEALSLSKELSGLNVATFGGVMRQGPLLINSEKVFKGENGIFSLLRYSVSISLQTILCPLGGGNKTAGFQEES